jgi:predicted dehydrogenase
MALKVAVVGAGYLGQHHARIYSELPDVELVAVVDTDGARAGEVAGKYASRWLSDYRDTFASVDALSIVVPTTDHCRIALDCIRAGKDVLVEKPITTTISEADELINEAAGRGRILQVGHLERYNPGVIALTRMVEEPRFLEAVRVSPFLNRGFDVDVTLDLMIHDVDIILGLVRSRVKSINAFGFSLVTGKIDEARAWIEFENGAAASLTASRIAAEKRRMLRVFQRNGSMELDYQTSAVELRFPARQGAAEIVRPEYHEPLKEELKDFVRCVGTRERPKVSGIEGREALSVVIEINSAMERHT